MRINYPTNHFMSVVENGDASSIKGIFGYGSHAFIHQIKGVTIGCVSNMLMWCEVLHGKNMINDAHFLKVKMVKDGDLLKNEFAIEECIRSGIGIYIFKFLPRYARTFVRRAKDRLFERKW